MTSTSFLFLGPQYTKDEDQALLNAIKNPGKDLRKLLPGRSLRSILRRISMLKKSQYSENTQPDGEFITNIIKLQFFVQRRCTVKRRIKS